MASLTPKLFLLPKPDLQFLFYLCPPSNLPLTFQTCLLPLLSGSPAWQMADYLPASTKVGTVNGYGCHGLLPSSGRGSYDAIPAHCCYN